MQEEYYDIYDENREKLGYTKERKQKLEAHEYIICCGVWVMDHQNRILLTQRAVEKAYAPLKWENTGGHMIPGETSRETAARELFEETGIRCTPEELEFVGTHRNQPFFGDDYLLVRDLDASEVVLQKGETQDVRWITIPEFLGWLAEDKLAGSTEYTWTYKMKGFLEKKGIL